MAEEQVHNIIVRKEDLSDYDSGGGYREVDARVTVDSSMSKHRQRVALIHEILGVFLGTVIPRENIEEIAEAIADGLRQLRG